ncbi:MAG: hypothetical protein SGILL_001237 [Bacillariaceae sp.]
MKLSKQYPRLLEKWQQESGKGLAATRSGRVGSVVVENVGSDDDDRGTMPSSNTTSTSIQRLKRTHLSPMLSLDNAHNDAQLMAWLRRVVKAATELTLEETEASMEESTIIKATIVTEPKLDGLSLSLRYEKQQDDHDDGGGEFILKWASTRGDGKVGQDVTAAVRQIPGIPTSIEMGAASAFAFDVVDAMEVRGEIVLPRSEFQRLQAEAVEAERIRLLQDPEEEEEANVTKSASATEKVVPVASFSNARNAASGILLRKESENEMEQAASEHLRSLLQFYAYDVAATTTATPQNQPDVVTLRSMLTDWGFSVAMPVTTTDLSWNLRDAVAEDKDTISISEEWAQEMLVDTNQVNPMMVYYSALMDYRTSLEAVIDNNSDALLSTDNRSSPKRKKPESTKEAKYEWGNYDMDGCVHKVSQATIRSFMGNSVKSPKYAIAHKFPAQCAVTHLMDIMVQVGRTGALTPVAVLEPVEVGGVIVQRATLHNFGHMTEVLGGEGGSMSSGKVPMMQPVLVRRAGDVIPQVPRAVTSLAHAFSRDAIDITGLSEARIEQLLEAELLRYPSDVFEMKDDQWEKMAGLPGWGKKSCANLRESITRVAANGISLGRFLYALGIRHVGKHSSELVASSYGTVEAFFDEVDKAILAKLGTEGNDMDESALSFFPTLQSKLGIGPVMIDSLISFSKSHESVDAAKSLWKSLKILEQDTQKNDTESSSVDDSFKPWKGYRVVFTGSLDGVTRSEAQKLAKLLGAKSTPGSVSKSTDLVVFGEKGGKKLEQARTFGINTMSSEEFIGLIQSRGLLEKN